MPGFVMYNRRWSLGSDDFLLPGILLATLHTIWLTVISILLSTSTLDEKEKCQVVYMEQLIGYLCLWSGSLILELCIVFTAARGTVFNDRPRAGMKYLIYIKQGLWLLEVCWVCLGVYWLAKYFQRSACSLSYTYKNVLLALVVCNLVSLSIFLLIVWCSWDYAGRSWFKLKKFQERALQSSSKHIRDGRYSGINRRSGGTTRNWRHRKVQRANQIAWDSRCSVLFCCARSDNKSKTSFTDIARLLSEFFRDLDVVPTDILVGLVLLRKRQQAARQRTISQPTNNVYDFLSGVKVTPDTQFVALNNPQELDKLRETVHYMHFALAAYGWPMYLLHNKTVPVHKAAWRLCSSLSCCCMSCCNHKVDVNSVILEDNCCLCNYAALKQVCHLDSTEIVYATYHVDVGETPFFIGVDFDKARIVISIRGTLSMQDIITDLNAESEILPLKPVNEDFKGHKGMVQAADYIYKKLMDENLLEKAFNWRTESGTRSFPLVCVGHSLGGGTAAILAILLKQEFPNITCFAFSPPGGLLSEQAMLASKEFITSVVVGKDVVPRLGMNQLETLRHELMATIKNSPENKWKTLSQSVICTRGNPDYSEDEAISMSPTAINVHPLDSSINLSVHQPLYPPGNIIHIVRHHPKDRRYKKNEPIYQAVWADNRDFDQVLISKCMVQDHMPDSVLDALEKACCSHAWHNVYTSRAIVGPTRQASTGLSDPVNKSETGPPDLVNKSGLGLHNPVLQAEKGQSISAHKSRTGLPNLVHKVGMGQLEPTQPAETEPARPEDICKQLHKAQSIQLIPSKKQLNPINNDPILKSKEQGESNLFPTSSMQMEDSFTQNSSEQVRKQYAKIQHSSLFTVNVEPVSCKNKQPSSSNPTLGSSLDVVPICDNKLVSERYLETSFELTEVLCKSVSENNLETHRNLVVCQQHLETLRGKVAPIASPEVSDVSSQSSRISQHIQILSTSRSSGENRNGSLSPNRETVSPNKGSFNRQQSDQRASSLSVRIEQNCRSSSRDSNSKLNASLESSSQQEHTIHSGIEAVVDIHKSKESSDDNDEEPSDGGLKPDKESREGLKPDEQPKEGIKSVKKIRTPSDIFSFYDISRDGATTV